MQQEVKVTTIQEAKDVSKLPLEEPSINGGE